MRQHVLDRYTELHNKFDGVILVRKLVKEMKTLAALGLSSTGPVVKVEAIAMVCQKNTKESTDNEIVTFPDGS